MTMAELYAALEKLDGGAAMVETIKAEVGKLNGESFGNWLESKGGRVLRQFTVNQDREFIGTSGVW